MWLICFSVKPLLKIVERCIPSEKTLAGEIFYPLKMEWNMLTHYYFPGELDVLVNGNCYQVLILIR